MISKQAAKLKKQIKLLKPLAIRANIKACRAAQDAFGAIGSRTLKRNVRMTELEFAEFSACLIEPAGIEDESSRKRLTVLYLHGGGYTAGGLEYSKGFGGMLCNALNCRVFCAAYRLAPEHRFPAALEDAFTAYQYLLDTGVSPDNLILAGESAGGGLCYCLIHRLKAMNLPLPSGIAAVSPWTDLACTGDSFNFNRYKDPSLDRDLLLDYAAMYTDDPMQPEVSPLYGELSGFPPSLIIVGGDELLLSDATQMADALTAAGSPVTLHIEEDMWHVYPLFTSPEANSAMDMIRTFSEALV